MEIKSLILLDPKFYPLQRRNLLYKGLHSVLRFFPHGVRDCGVSVHSKRAGVMAQLLLNSLYAVTGLQGIDGVAVPLRYN